MSNKQVQFEQPSNLLLFFNRFWIIITAVLIGVLLLGGYYLVIKPKMDSNDVLREDALKVSVDQNNSEQLLKNLETLEITYQNIINNRQADLDRIKEIVPNNPQIAELFVLSDRLARQYGLQLLDININDSVEKKVATTQVVDESVEGVVTPVPTSTTVAKKGPILKTLTIDFTVSTVALRDETGNILLDINAKTNYQLFKDFLDALEKNLRLTDIQTINFSSLQDSANAAPQFKFSVQTYYR